MNPWSHAMFVVELGLDQGSPAGPQSVRNRGRTVGGEWRGRASEASSAFPRITA